MALKRKASAYPPGFSKRAPREGFAVKGAGDARDRDYNTIDPYKTYTDATEDEEIWNLLQSEAGRQALGAQMAIPIREQLDYQGMCRRFFEIDVLAQGQIARYDKDIDGFATTVAKRGEVVDFIVEGEYVEPNTWEIFSPSGIRLSEIQQRRFNVLDRMQEKIRIHVQLEEDTQFLALALATAAANQGNNPYVTSTVGLSKDFLNELATTIQDHDLPCYAFLMDMKSYSHIRSWQRDDVDPVTQREIMQTGLMGSIWGIDIIVSRKVDEGEVYCFSEPRFTGVLPIRTDLILMPDDEPKRALIAYVGYEEIGMLIVNANSVAKGTFTGRIPCPCAS